MKILILFAHPALHRSNINRQLVGDIAAVEGVTFHDLYELYPDYDIDIRLEQQLLIQHDCIIFHHPMYWYNMPALLKEWLDLVLTHGWAYGSEGTALKGKLFFNAITTGGPKKAFTVDGMHKHGVRDLLIPVHLTAKRCGMISLPPFVVHGTYSMDADELRVYRNKYKTLLRNIVEDLFDYQKAEGLEYLNDHPIMEEV